MFTRTTSLVACLSLLAAASPAVAQSTDQDAQCVLVSNVFANGEKDPARKQIALASAFFYLGRVNARLPAAQLKSVMEAQGKALTGQDVAKIMTACAQRLQSVQRDMKAIGESIVGAQKKKPGT